MKKILLIISLLLSGFSFAGGNPAEGKKKVEQVCKSCHGMDGLGINDTYPKLAGQFADYIAKALTDYKSGDRKNPIMSGFAASLSEKDIENVAAYYSRLTVDKLHDLSIK